MPRLVELSVKDFLTAVAARTPTPGGGAVAAAAAAAGAALAQMVARYSSTGACAAAADELEPLRDLLTRLVDEDAEAYRRVEAALAMAKETPEQQKKRAEALQGAYRKAAEAPLGVMGSSAAALRRLPVLGREGNARLASDLGGAVHLLSAGLQMAHLYVRVNAAQLTDAAAKQTFAAQAADLVAEAASLVEQVFTAMKGANSGKN